MTKRTLILIIAIFLTISGFAQKTITGRVIDEHGAPLSYVTVALLNHGDSTLRFFGVTNTLGKYQIKNIKEGKYIMQFSYVGMKTSCKNINASEGSSGDFGDKVLQSLMLGQVEVVAEYIPIVFKNDTVEFNAKAFDVKPDAVAEDLLKKIPGLEVDESGNVKALGEDVTKILVDGKEFFGKDLKVATKNLPANAIEKVQVYDKKSEEAEFMGIDDGVRDRTINLLLNKDHKKGYFGDVQVGGGTDDYYMAEAKVYRFSSKLQSAVLGMYNNINEFGFSSKGHSQWGQTIDGVNNTLAGGLNLSYNISDKKRYFISYLANSTDKLLIRKTETENFIPSGSYFQNTDLYQDENNSPHTINLGVRHSFNANSKLTVDGDIDISANNMVSSVLTKSSRNDTTINLYNNNTNDLSNVTSASGKAVYIHKLNEEKTQIKTNMSFSYDNSVSELDWENLTYIFNPLITNSVEQYQNNDTRNLNLSVNPTLVQKLKQFWHLTANVDLSSDKESLDREFGAMDIFVDSLSADFRTERLSIQPALAIKRGSEKTQFQITLGAGIDQFDIINTGFTDGTPSNIEENYLHLLPGFTYENYYKKGRRIKLRYRSDVNMPSISQLLPIVNNINTLSLYKGNINLKPEYSHNLSFMWSIFDQFSFTSMFFRVSGGYTIDKISFSQSIGDDYIKIITPENVAYDGSVNAFFYFSTPIRSLGAKINVRGHESWNQGISNINSVENINSSFNHSVKISFENRTKKKWDVNVGGSISLTDSKFSIAENLNNVYYNTSYFSQLRFTPNKKWSFETEGAVANYSSKNFDESFNIPLIEAGISYFFLKSEKASLSIKGYDLLNKSSNISQITNSNYLTHQTSNTIGRYVMLVFKMKIGKGGGGEDGGGGSGRGHRH